MFSLEISVCIISFRFCNQSLVGGSSWLKAAEPDKLPQNPTGKPIRIRIDRNSVLPGHGKTRRWVIKQYCYVIQSNKEIKLPIAAATAIKLRVCITLTHHLCSPCIVSKTKKAPRCSSVSISKALLLITFLFVHIKKLHYSFSEIVIEYYFQ